MSENHSGARGAFEAVAFGKSANLGMSKALNLGVLGRSANLGTSKALNMGALGVTTNLNHRLVFGGINAQASPLAKSQASLLARIQPSLLAKSQSNLVAKSQMSLLANSHANLIGKALQQHVAVVGLTGVQASLAKKAFGAQMQLGALRHDAAINTVLNDLVRKTQLVGGSALIADMTKAARMGALAHSSSHVSAARLLGQIGAQRAIGLTLAGAVAQSVLADDSDGSAATDSDAQCADGPFPVRAFADYMFAIVFLALVGWYLAEANRTGQDLARMNAVEAGEHFTTWLGIAWAARQGVLSVLNDE